MDYGSIREIKCFFVFLVGIAHSECCGLLCRLYSENVENIEMIAEAFGRCKRLECLSALWDLDERSLTMVMPIAARIKSLDLTYSVLEQEQFVDLLGSCVNLEILQVCLANCTTKHQLFFKCFEQ